MNEEYKKKYLKYKIKYLELIGSVPDRTREPYLELIGGAASNSQRKREPYLEVIAIFNFLLKIHEKGEDITDGGKQYNKVFKSDRSFFFEDHIDLKNGELQYLKYLNLLKIEDQLVNNSKPDESLKGEDLKQLDEIQKALNKQSAFGTVKNIITNFKYDLSDVDLIYIKQVINEFIKKHKTDTKEDVKIYEIDKDHIVPEIKIKQVEENIEQTLNSQLQTPPESPTPTPGSLGSPPVQTDPTPAAKTGSTTEEIKNLFKLLQYKINKNNKTALAEMNEKIPQDIYSEDNLASFISNIADCIGMGRDSDYITNIEEYIKNIKEYIKKNFIEEIFKGEKLYKLFIFIVIEFGKQFNLEGPVITRMEKLLLPIELNVIDTAGAPNATSASTGAPTGAPNPTSAPKASSAQNVPGSSVDFGVLGQAAAAVGSMMR